MCKGTDQYCITCSQRTGSQPHRQGPSWLERCHYRFSVQGQRVKIKLCQLQTYISVLCTRQSFRSLLHRQQRPQQSGFTAGRLTVDAILALRLLSELYRKSSKPLHVSYVDIKAAFDSVWTGSTMEGSSGWACAAIPNQSHKAPAHWNEVMRPSWQESHSFVPYIFRGPTRLCPGARPVSHCHWLDHVHMCRQGRCQRRTVPVHRHWLCRWCGPVRWGRRSVAVHPWIIRYSCEHWAKTKILNVASGISPPSSVISGHQVEAVNRFPYLARHWCWLIRLLYTRNSREDRLSFIHYVPAGSCLEAESVE